MNIINNIEELNGSELRQLASEIRRNGHNKPYEEFKAEMKVVVDEINRRGRIIAKKHNRRYAPVSVIQTMRG
jgi:hypothetical protein